VKPVDRDRLTTSIKQALAFADLRRENRVLGDRLLSGDLKNPEHPDELGSQDCWCNMTQHVKGPDQADVDRCACTPGRECYRDTYEV
ncbi:MAG: hypothetical protein QF918_04205, partial [Pirellulaceae bacterium]|nr:hypothetical protein [Pirellulaceae bacterium]